MINTSTTYNQLSNITSNINDLTSQIASGKKTLNSQELNKSLEIKESIFQKDEIINQIETFKEDTNQVDKYLSEIKSNLESFKVLRIKDNAKDITKNEMKTIIENIDDILKKEVFKNDSVLVDNGLYKKVNLSKENIFKDYKNDLENIMNNPSENDFDTLNNIYDDVNSKHSEVGSLNNYFDNKIEEHNKINLNNKISQSQLEDLDYTNAIINLNLLSLQYNAMATTIAKKNELSLMNFLK